MKLSHNLCTYFKIFNIKTKRLLINFNWQDSWVTMTWLKRATLWLTAKIVIGLFLSANYRNNSYISSISDKDYAKFVWNVASNQIDNLEKLQKFPQSLLWQTSESFLLIFCNVSLLYWLLPHFLFCIFHTYSWTEWDRKHPPFQFKHFMWVPI